MCAKPTPTTQHKKFRTFRAFRKFRDFRKQKFIFISKNPIFPPQNFAQSKIILTFALLIPRWGSLLCWVGLADILFIGVYRRFVSAI